MSKRKFSSRTRRTKVRDARLIIIATEGEHTEKQSFQALADAYRNSKIHVEILATTDTKSAPNHVIERLKQFEKQYSLEASDELWLVIDVDSWKVNQLSEIAKTCNDNQYLLAVSNPCFELWLLLHVAEWDDYSDEQVQGFFENAKDSNRNALEKELMWLVGEHRKSNLKTDCISRMLRKRLNRQKHSIPIPMTVGHRVSALAFTSLPNLSSTKSSVSTVASRTESNRRFRCAGGRRDCVQVFAVTG